MKKYCLPLLLMIFLIALSAGESGAYEFGKNKVQYENFDWQVYHSPHFELYYYEEEEMLASQAILLAEQAYERLALRLDHRPKRRIPLVLYSSHPSFQQSNVTPELISEGTGGFTDIYRSRVVLPYNGSVPEFRHVIAHELVHVFMLDMLFGGSGPEHIMRSLGQFQMPPLWFIEGMAEYLSTGWDAEAQLFLEDAVASEYLAPLDDYVGGFLVYKEGQAAASYLAERFGDGILPELLREMAGRGNMERALKKRTGLSFKELSEAFLRETRQKAWSGLADRPRPGDRSFLLLDHESEKRFFHLSPVFSPDGDRIAYFADNDGEVNLYLASSLDGKELRRLVTGQRSGDLESLHAFDSNASFEPGPNGKRLAFIALAGGKDELVIVDAASGEELARHRPGLDSMRGPAWSPDGKSIAVSGVKGGVTDLYILNLEDGSWRQLTDDLADEQNPAWLGADILLYARHQPLLPGRFTYPGRHLPQDIELDEFGDHPEIFDSGSGYDIWRLSLAGEAGPYAATAGDDRHPMPMADGGLLFTSTVGGLQELWWQGAGAASPRRLYGPAGGVITPSLAPDGGRLAFSSLNGGGYDLLILEELEPMLAEAGAEPAAAALDQPVYPPFGMLPDSSDVAPASVAKVEEPDSLTGTGMPYHTRFLVDALGRQVTYDTLYGFYGSTVITFKDVLGDQEIFLLLDIFGNISDSNLMISYTRRKSRLNWSAGAYTFLSYYQTRVGSFGEYFPSDRLALEWRRGGFLSGSYPFNLFMRMDADLNLLYARREFFSGVDPFGNVVEVADSVGGDPEKRVLVQPSLSLVYDDALFDYLGPVKGSRWALSAAYAHNLGGDIPVARWLAYADWRRYLLGPGGHSIALRASARFSEGVDPVVYYLGGPWDLRGFEYLELDGNKTVLGSVEWRFPFIRYLALGGPLPITWGGIGASVFADFGGAWYGDNFRVFKKDASGLELQDLRGDIGYGFRMGLGGFLLLWDFAWPTDLKHLGGRQVHFSIGTQF